MSPLRSFVMTSLCVFALTRAVGAEPFPATRYAFTSFNLPNAVDDYAWTMPTSINWKGIITVAFNFYEHGLQQPSAVYNGLTITASVTCNGTTQWTAVQGINDAGAMTGWCLTGDRVTAFLRDKNGKVTILPLPPGAILAEGMDINNHTNITGHFTDAAGLSHGWFYHAKTKAITVFDAPFAGVTHTIPIGMNNSDDIVGITYTANGPPKGFQYKIRTNRWIGIDVEGADTVVPVGINDFFGIVGTHSNMTTGTWSFLYKDGNLTHFTLPFQAGLLALNLVDVNNDGKILGTYETLIHSPEPDGGQTGFIHGFLATPLPDAPAQARRQNASFATASLAATPASGETSLAPMYLRGCPGDGMVRPGKLTHSWALCGK